MTTLSHLDTPFELVVDAILYPAIYVPRAMSSETLSKFSVSFSLANLSPPDQARWMGRRRRSAQMLAHASSNLRPPIQEPNRRFAELAAILQEADVRNFSRDKTFDGAPATLKLMWFRWDSPVAAGYGLSLLGLTVDVTTLRLPE